MGLDLEYISGQTHLDEDEKDGLLLPSITSRKDLNEFEQLNIEQAIQWTLSRTFTAAEFFTEAFTRELHRRMFGGVWKWAGVFRETNKNIGVDKFEIGVELRQLNDDCLYWIEHRTYGEDEISVRYKHRLVFIHCFPNGNGRHSRLMADILVEKILGGPIFTWGSADLDGESDDRKTYISALRKADRGDIGPLIKFARS